MHWLGANLQPCWQLAFSLRSEKRLMSPLLRKFRLIVS